MDIRLAVTVLGVLLVQVQGHPGTPEESLVSSAEDTKRIVPLEVAGTKEPVKTDSLDTFSTKEVKKTTSGEKEESAGKSKVPLTSLDTKLKVRLPEDSTSKEAEEEALRSPRQLSPQSSPYHHQMSVGKGPHTTTVCIQVRSDHNPQVICGPQYAEREDPPAPSPAAARYADPYEFARPPQGYGRAPPAPARGFPLRRSDDELRPLDPNSHPASGLGPQHSPQAPPRLLPSAPPSPGPVYVQGPQYNPALYTGQLVSPLQALMRLNCAVEPAGQLLSPHYTRGGPLGYPDQSLGLGEAVYTLPDGSGAQFGANIGPPTPIRTQNYAAAPHGYLQRARSSAADEDMAYLRSQMSGSPQDYGGYPLDMMQGMQGRSASGEDGSQAYLGYPNEYLQAADDFARREYIQLQALRESKDRLKDIEQELTAYRQREELLKMNANNSSSESSKEKPAAGGGISIDITAKPVKASKRHTRT